MKYTQTYLVFDNIHGKKVEVDYKGESTTSDAGAIILRQVIRKTGIIKRIEGALRDRRHQSYTEHQIGELITQRVIQIACGYPEAIAGNILRNDPAMKLGCDRLPQTGDELASQPTLCRFENSMSRTDIYRMSKAIFDAFIASYSKPPRRIILDLDETCDPTHGAQQQSLFNTHYDTYCYLPIHIYETTTDRLVTTVLRPGRRPKGVEIAAILGRVLKELRRLWPKTRIIVRGDSHYGVPETMEVCERHDVWYIFGLSGNTALHRLADESLWHSVWKVIGSYRTYKEFMYAAGSWSSARRVVARIAANECGVDLRYIVTNMPYKKARTLYEKIYCQRGRMENLFKDHKNALRSDLTSCTSFIANAFRLLLHSTAYVVVHYIREKLLAGTKLATAHFDTLRMKLFKVAAKVEEKSKVIRLHFPNTYAYRDLFLHVHRLLQ